MCYLSLALKFNQLNLPEPLMRAVEDLGFESPTPIQAQALPVLLDSRDLAGQAQTGTGKTACFLLAAMTRLLETERPADGPVEAAEVPEAAVECLSPIRLDDRLSCDFDSASVRVGLYVLDCQKAAQQQQCSPAADISISETSTSTDESPVSTIDVDADASTI